MTTLVYNGPPHQTCHELAELTGVDGTLEPGRSYEMPCEFAARLLAGNAHWEAPAAPKPPTKKELQAHANELGLQLPASASVSKLQEAIAAAEAAAADTTPAGDAGDDDAAAAGAAGEES